MKKVIAAINMVLDRFYGHILGILDEEIHQHYAKLLRSTDTVLHRRIIHRLIEFWRTIVDNPTGDNATDDFAIAIDNTQKKTFLGH